MKLSTELIGGSLLASQVLTSVLKIGENSEPMGEQWGSNRISKVWWRVNQMSLSFNQSLGSGSFFLIFLLWIFYQVCFAKFITSRAALRRSISRLRIASFSISLSERENESQRSKEANLSLLFSRRLILPRNSATSPSRVAIAASRS